MAKLEHTQDNTIVELEAELRSYDRFIKRHPDDDNAYYLKAGILVKLGQHVQDRTQDYTYYYKALECYTKAITLFPQNSLYLIDRSKLYLLMNQIDLASQDAELVKKLQAQNSKDKNKDGEDNSSNNWSSNNSQDNATKVQDLYVANTLKKIDQEIIEKIKIKDKPTNSPTNKLEHKLGQEQVASTQILNTLEAKEIENTDAISQIKQAESINQCSSIIDAKELTKVPEIANPANVVETSESSLIEQATQAPAHNNHGNFWGYLSMGGIALGLVGVVLQASMDYFE